MYGSFLLICSVVFFATWFIRRLMRLPPRADFYVALVAIVYSNIVYLQPYVNRLVRRVTTAINPRFYDELYMKRPDRGNER